MFFVLLPQTRHPKRSASVLLPQTRHPERSAFVLLPQTRHPERSAFVLLPQTRHPERSAFVLLPQTRHPERSAFVLLPQTRHPERSASQIDRMTQRFWRGVEGPRRCLFCRYWSELSTIEPRAGRDPLRFVPVAETNNLKDVSVTMKSVSQQILLSASVSKSFEQHGQRKHRRGPSTPRQKRCVIRSICEALRSG
jgi:hypothetical protein